MKPITPYPFTFADGEPSFPPESLGQVAWCNEAEQDCFVVSTLSYGIPKDTEVHYALFLKDTSELCNKSAEVTWDVRVAHGSVGHYPSWRGTNYSHTIKYITREYGEFQVVVDIAVESAHRRIVMRQFVKRSYPVLDILKQLEERLDQDVKRYVWWILRAPIEILQRMPLLGHLLLLILRNCGVFEKAYGDTDLDQLEKMSLIGDQEKVQSFIDKYAIYIAEIYNLAAFLDQELKVPKELLAGLLFYLAGKSKTYLEKLTSTISKNTQNQALKEYKLIGPFGLRPGAVAYVVGENGLGIKDSYLWSRNSTGPAQQPVVLVVDLIQQYEAELYGSSVNEELQVQKIQLETLALFPKAAIQISYELLSGIHLLEEPFQLNYDENMVETQINDIGNVRRDLLEKFFSFYFAVEPQPALGEMAKKIEQLSVHPSLSIITSGGVGARKVTAKVKNNEVSGIVDLAHPLTRQVASTFIWDRDLNTNLDATQLEHFGWVPSEQKGNLDRKTIEDWEMVFLDAGFWGHYNREDPRRDFGAAEGKNIFLCSLVYEDDPGQASDLEQKDDLVLTRDGVQKIHGETKYRLNAISLGGSILESLADLLYDNWGYTIEIVSWTKAPPVPRMEDTNAADNSSTDDNGTEFPSDTLMLFFPDMHLPEKWPDIPDGSAYTGAPGEPDDGKRKALRKLLWKTQATPIEINGSRSDFQTVNDWYLYCQEQRQSKLLERASIHQYLAKAIADPDNLPTYILNVVNEIYEFKGFSPRQVLHEYAMVERMIRVDNSWFYPPLGTQDVTDHKDKRAEDITVPQLQGDPAPAIDLAALLFACNNLISDGKKITYFQVGDFYEMWMGNEWLYKDMPVYQNQSPPEEFILSAIDKFGDADLGGQDRGSFQYRLGRYWQSYAGFEDWDHRHLDGLGYEFLLRQDGRPKPLDESIPLYYYHEWPREEILKRRDVGTSASGNMIDKENTEENAPDSKAEAYFDRVFSEMGSDLLSKFERINQEINRRVASIQEFTLPIPDDLDRPVARRRFLEYLKTKHPQNGEEYWSPTTGEFYWNKLLIDQFKKNKNCQFVCGNHDGYRGDPILQKTGGEEWGVMPFFTGNGYWVEHGHRWDPYNIDGNPLGAAVTNQVHYHMRPETQTLDRALSLFVPRFHKEILPAFAQWFLLVNSKPDVFRYCPDRATGEIVTPKRFSVCCSGHSHTADLLKIRFKREEG